MAKYKNQTFINEFGKWDSKLEYYRYLVLLDAQKKGLITGLERQKEFVLIPAQSETFMRTKKTRKGLVNKQITRVVEREVTYLADFFYYRISDCGLGHPVIEDTKGYHTRDYIIKRKLMRYNGNPIREVRNANETV